MADPSDTELLLQRAEAGDRDARGELLERHSPRLRRLIGIRLDPRLAARIDPSDVLQETLAVADRRLPAFLRDRPLPFYPWMRRIAADRITDAYRRHLGAGRRSVKREEPPGLPGESVVELANRLAAPTSGPSARLHRQERSGRVRDALKSLPEKEREVLVLRYLEDLSTADAAAVMGVSESAIKMRLVRALQRLRDVLDEEDVS